MKHVKFARLGVAVWLLSCNNKPLPPTPTPAPAISQVVEFSIAPGRQLPVTHIRWRSGQGLSNRLQAAACYRNLQYSLGHYFYHQEPAPIPGGNFADSNHQNI